MILLAGSIFIFKFKAYQYYKITIEEVAMLLRLTRYYIAFVCFLVVRERSQNFHEFKRKELLGISCKMNHFT